jgi:hypothetical protein
VRIKVRRAALIRWMPKTPIFLAVRRRTDTGRRSNHRVKDAAGCRILSQRPAGSPRWSRFAVVALLCLYAALSWTASFSKGVSFDEGLQLGVGYNIWKNRDLRVQGANGDLIKRWATLPYLLSRPAFVSQDRTSWRDGSGYELGDEFLFSVGNRPDSLLKQGRAMIALLGVATGLLVFLASRALFGLAGGLVSLAMFVFSPSMLAFGGVVSTDMSATLTLFASTYFLWRLLHDISCRSFLLSLGSVALVVLAKASGLVIIPIAIALVGIRLMAGTPLKVRWRGGNTDVNGRSRQALLFAGLAAIHAVAAWAAIWAHYEFRYAKDVTVDQANARAA